MKPPCLTWDRFRWIRIVAVVVVLSALVVWALANNLLGGVITVALVVGIAAIPWRVLDLTWSWWVGTLAGGVIGWAADFIALFAISCIDCPEPNSGTPNWAVILFSSIFMTFVGLGQAFALADAEERIYWIFASSAAGFSIGLLAYLMPNQPLGNVVGIIIAAIILGFALLIIARSRSLNAGSRG